MATLLERATELRKIPKYSRKKTVLVKNIEVNPFRISDIPRFSIQNLPTSFVVNDGVQGNPKRFYFYDQNQNDQHQLTINKEMVFDTANNVDLCNLATLELFLNEYPDWKNKLVIVDEQEESRERIENEERVIICKSALFKRKDDKAFLSMLYRRLKGITIGITENVLLDTLINIATEGGLHILMIVFLAMPNL